MCVRAFLPYVLDSPNWAIDRWMDRDHESGLGMIEEGLFGLPRMLLKGGTCLFWHCAWSDRTGFFRKSTTCTYKLDWQEEEDSRSPIVLLFYPTLCTIECMSQRGISVWSS